MARFVGSTSSKGQVPSVTIIPTTPFTRSTGITTDVNNNVTSVTLGDASYTSVLYNNVGLITAYTETISGVSKDYVLNYEADYTLTSITEVS
jgi:hypothetical protein